MQLRKKKDPPRKEHFPGLCGHNERGPCKHIIPYFKDIKLQNITAKMIEDWVLKLRETPGENGKTLSHSTVNPSLISIKR